MKPLLLVLPSVAGLFVLVAAAAYWLQDRLIYFPRPYAEAHLRSFAGRGGAVLRFSAPHGDQVAFFVPPPASGPADLPERIWCCFAGNGGQALAWEDLARHHQTDGVAFLFVEWPGYGASAGKPRAETIRSSARGAAKALADHLGVAPETLRTRFRTVGHSLGAAGALLAAHELEATEAVLFAPFTSLRDMAVLQMGPVIGRFVSHDYDNRSALAQVAARTGTRVTIFHGTEDEVIPVAMARELRDRHPDTVRLVELPGADHNGLFGPAAPFFREVLRGSP